MNCAESGKRDKSVDSIQMFTVDWTKGGLISVGNHLNLPYLCVIRNEFVAFIEVYKMTYFICRKNFSSQNARSSLVEIMILNIFLQNWMDLIKEKISKYSQSFTVVNSPENGTCMD